uniref:NADH dehydrogenase subunit 4L n=1 Tax=Dreissena polymorpha TaxID=45954 RepID=A0A1P8NLX9_DREPO|nr:NADH dehydrogenase subunit 4L [Dreissena polymorpha]UUJ37917.1 NADH dehydrogenase subunit 4L [Dreissena polymorpha]
MMKLILLCMFLLPVVIYSESFFVMMIFSESLMALIFTLVTWSGLFNFSGFLGHLLVAFLAFAVSEAVLGLTLFIKSSRSSSSSSSKSFSTLKF